MPKYMVSVKIYNSFEIEANSEEEAEQEVRELDAYQTLNDCDFNIEDVVAICPDPFETWKIARLRDCERILENDDKGTPEGVLKKLTEGQRKVMKREIERIKEELER
tara:strand:- start:656 stop:976 length:321 start_codon:yes stop_codon:yes gene_type:complete